MQFLQQEQQQRSKQNILSQKSSRKPSRLLGSLALITIIPFFGIVTAFGIAPQTITNNIETRIVDEAISLPQESANYASSDVNLPNQASMQDYWQTDVVRRDDTLSSLIKRLNIKDSDAINFLQTNSDAQIFTAHLRPGRMVQASTDDAGKLIQLLYDADNNSTVIIKRDANDAFAAYSEPVNTTKRLVMKSAFIQSSLFGATDKANIPDKIALKLADIFASDIDFNSDLRRGDRFKVVYEVDTAEGDTVSTGDVVAAEFINQGKTYRAIMYRAPDGSANYYTPEGKSLRKSFLRSPLEFTRISSGFSLGRFHPILQKIRAHKGVDFAAPIGTGVRASGDATVAFVGTKSGFGNVIELNHDRGITTVYGHLSRFASGLRKGMKVKQGDLIAYVGMTGLATGPHLHYEFRINGEHHDPMTVALPQATPIAPQFLADFNAHSADMQARLALLNTAVASLD